MKSPALLPNEKDRQRALDALGVLDTGPEQAFDQITELAAAICGTPIALISLVDRDRQWFKSKRGVSASQTSREDSFCAHAIHSDGIFEIRDARQHPDFSDSPLVRGELQVVFYAGAVLKTSGGQHVGTLCVIDSAPHQLDELQRKALLTLARQAVALMELRLYRDSTQKVFSQLQEAQRISQIGSWQFNPITHEQSWSSEHYRIFEIEEPQPQEALYRMYRERIHPEDLPELDRLVRRALEQGEDFIYDHRVWLDGGKRIKFVQGIGKVSKDAEGRVVLISGTCRDKTRDVVNESRYSTLIEAMGEGLLVRNAEGRIIQHNPAALRILGLTEAQLNDPGLRDPRWRVLNEDGTECSLENLPSWSALSSNHHVTDVTLGVRLPSTEVRWVRVNVVPLETPQGRIATITFSDITTLVQIQGENRFILETLDIGIWKYNPISRELHWDASMYRLYGMAPEDFSGHYDAWASSLAPETAELAKATLDRAIDGGGEFNLTFEIITPSGSRKHIGARATVVRDERGRATMMYGINWDRSKEVEMESHLQQERQKAIRNAKLASLGEMAAGIAHEINNPLAVIEASAFLLPRCREDEARFEGRVDAIRKATERVARIVKGLRKFSRSSENTLRQCENLAELLAEALVLTEARAKRHSVAIEIDCSSSAAIVCDGVEIEQVLVNLINNAIDAVSDRDERWVRVRVEEHAGGVEVSVTDSGCGISPDVERRLFEPFFTTKPVGQGTGLGLSISRGIVEDHGATISLDRESPNTRFVIQFLETKEGRHGDSAGVRG
jgi:PAS domain S-box-containing protein